MLYQTCKAAIEGLTRALARDLGARQYPRQLRRARATSARRASCNGTRPKAKPRSSTRSASKGRLVPEDVAALVLFLASDDARLMTGHEYFVDAGWR